MRLDNEAFPVFQSLVMDKCIDYQLAPPGIHRRNAAERVIHTFKYHFITGVCTTEPDFLMQNWDRLLERAEIMINLLLHSILNPRLSAYAKINGEFDFNRTHMPPPGTRTLVHDKPQNIGIWAPYVNKGCYVRLAILHYRCLTSYIPRRQTKESQT